MVAGEAVQGTVADGFEAVRDEFSAVAAGEPGLGAQLAAYRYGELVVDLWTGAELTSDSLLGVYSASKGAAHLDVALLVQDGVLDLDQRVSHYWVRSAVLAPRDRVRLPRPDQGEAGDVTVGELDRPGVDPADPERAWYWCGRHGCRCNRASLQLVPE